MACPHSLPVPGRTLITPGGMPALTASSANLSAVRGQTCQKKRVTYYISILLCFEKNCSYLGWLNDNSISCCQAGRHFPREHHEGVVPWRDEAANSDRLPSGHSEVTIGSCMVNWNSYA